RADWTHQVPLARESRSDTAIRLALLLVGFLRSQLLSEGGALPGAAAPRSRGAHLRAGRARLFSRVVLPTSLDGGLLRRLRARLRLRPLELPARPYGRHLAPGLERHLGESSDSGARDGTLRQARRARLCQGRPGGKGREEAFRLRRTEISARERGPLRQRRRMGACRSGAARVRRWQDARLEPACLCALGAPQDSVPFEARLGRRRSGSRERLGVETRQ